MSFFFVASKLNTFIFFDLKIKFEILISRQKIFALTKNFENAAAEAPE